MDNRTPDDFMVSKLIGEDSDSTTVRARDIKTDNEFAIKIFDKKILEKGSKRANLEREKEILAVIDHPFFVTLYHVFEDPKRLYFALSLASGGDLLTFIESNGGLSRSCAKHYTAEIVVALEYLRTINIVHRDLKPENILLTSDLHIHITDFGGAVRFKRDSKKEHKKVTAVRGTSWYAAPEVVNSKICHLNSDLWSLGCIIYHMLTGKAMIEDQVNHAKYEKIMLPLLKRPGIADDQATDLIKSLLKIEPSERLGGEKSEGFDTLKRHEFFTGISWEDLHVRVPPPATRSVTSTSSKSDSDKSLTSRHLSSGTAARLSPNKDGTMKREQKPASKKKLDASDPDDIEGYGIPVDISGSERDCWLKKQQSSTWHHFADGALILKRAELDKKRSLSVKSRQFLLLEGPRLIYVDPSNLEVKGEIPWSRELQVEVKSFKSFNISVPGRTYHLVDRKGNALKWCRKLDDVWEHYYGTKR